MPAGAALSAQVDTTRRPPIPQDTTVRDTTARDTSAARDTLPALLPTMAPALVGGPLPRGARYTFTMDSILLSSARTLSDLLIHIPGVYVARGGWFGQAEIVLYAGRGPASVEIYWDGMRMLPIGGDSLYLDPARIPLGPIERVDVIILPASLQVYLVTNRYRSTSPQTQIGVLTGRQDIAGYRAGYARRTRSGFGLNLVMDWSSISAGPTGNTSTPFGTADLWLKAEYLPPKGHWGASYQISSNSWHRTGEANSSGDTVVAGWRQERRDRLLELFVASRADGLGWRLSTQLAQSGINKGTFVNKRGISVGSVEASFATNRATVIGIARYGTGGAPKQFEGRIGVMPLAGITLAGSIRQSLYSDDRKGAQAYGMAGLALPLGFSIRGEASWRKDPQSPFVATTLVADQMDVAAWLRFDHRLFSVEVGRGRRDPFEPAGFAEGIGTIDSLAPTPATDFLAARGMVRVAPGLTFSGWYYDPIVGGGDFEPPNHARISATFYSKFWRVFKSGIFALRVELAEESWSRSIGSGGGISAGKRFGLAGTTFTEANVEMQLGGVTLFWDSKNINVTTASYVPGLGYPKAAQQWGARWFFTN
jgi:hypothetical protein